MRQRARVVYLTVCCRKKQMDIRFSCVCPVIDNEIRHNIVKVVCGSTSTLTMLWNSLSTTGQTHERLPGKTDVNLLIWHSSENRPKCKSLRSSKRGQKNGRVHVFGALSNGGREIIGDFSSADSNNMLKVRWKKYVVMASMTPTFFKKVTRLLVLPDWALSCIECFRENGTINGWCIIKCTWGLKWNKIEFNNVTWFVWYPATSACSSSLKFSVSMWVCIPGITVKVGKG